MYLGSCISPRHTLQSETVWGLITCIFNSPEAWIVCPNTIKLLTNPILSLYMGWWSCCLSAGQRFSGWEKGEQVLLIWIAYLIPVSELTSGSEQGLCPELGCSQHPSGKTLLALVPAWGPLHGRGCKYHRDSEKTSRTLSCKQKSCSACCYVSYPKT